MMHLSAPAGVILQGTVGSTAYGLATDDSDVDTLGVFVPSTDALLLSLSGIGSVAETVTSASPDACWHSVAKYARLALAVNPTVYELLWLPAYDVVDEHGEALVGIRSAFLSAGKVRDSYLGYATSQFKRLQARGDGTFGSDTRNRAAKHARHMARLVRQGRELYETGALTVNVGGDADWFHEFAAAGPDVWAAWFEREAPLFADARSCLPVAPDRGVVGDWLRTVYLGRA